MHVWLVILCQEFENMGQMHRLD